MGLFPLICKLRFFTWKLKIHSFFYQKLLKWYLGENYGAKTHQKYNAVGKIINQAFIIMYCKGPCSGNVGSHGSMQECWIRQEGGGWTAIAATSLQNFRCVEVYQRAPADCSHVWWLEFLKKSNEKLWVKENML